MSITPELLAAAHAYGEAKVRLALALDEHRAASGLIALAAAPIAVPPAAGVAPVAAAAAVAKDTPPAPEKPKFCECSVAFRKGEPCPYPGVSVRKSRTKIVPEGGGAARLRTLTEQCHKDWEKHHKPKSTGTGGGRKKQKTLDSNLSKSNSAQQQQQQQQQQEGDVEDVVERYEEEEEEEEEDEDEDIKLPTKRAPPVQLVREEEEEEEQEDDDDDDEVCMEPEL